MKSKVGSTIATYCFLAVAGGMCLVMPDTIGPIASLASPADTGPPVVHLRGAVRRFSREHSDFRVMPAQGYGHYVGLVDATLGADDRPVFAGQGRRVLTDAKDDQRRPISPHVAFRRPDPQRRLLMVLRESDQWQIAELVKRFLLESWGYEVTPIAAAAMPSRYREAIERNDVVYIGEDIRPEELFNKFDYPLQTAAIGIVNEERYLSGGEPEVLSPGLGLAADGCEAFGSTAVEIVDADHWITADFPVGPLALFATPQPMYALQSDQVAPGARILGRQVNRPNVQLLSLQAGDELAGGGLAAGRRVQMPFGRWALERGSLTAEGQRLMRRMVDWAAANDGNRHGHPNDVAARLDPVVCSAGIASASSFTEWFETVSDDAREDGLVLPLHRQGDGAYHLSPSAVATIAGQHFTGSFEANFVYNAAAEASLEVSSNADVWIFIGDELAIDLGGIHDVLHQRIDLRRLGLTDGASYTLRLFMAHRSTQVPRLDIISNIAFTPAPAGTSMPNAAAPTPFAGR